VAVRAAREAATDMMTRAAHDAREGMTADNAHRTWRCARSVVLPSVLLVLGLLVEIAATIIWLYS
jgi:hypothetical protein